LTSVAIVTLFGALPDAMKRRLLAEHGRLLLHATSEETAQRLVEVLDRASLLRHLAGRPDDLRQVHTIVSQGGRWPGRAEALISVACAIGAPVPAAEYGLPERDLEALLMKIRALHGERLVIRGEAGHKGRVGDAVERRLLGGKVVGKGADHPAAEVKSVPVRGDAVIERVKLGVVSERSNPLDKCARVLFVFVEQRGDEHFIRGHAMCEFDRTRWQAMWRDGHLVETAAGSPEHPARGLYLTPRWFRAERLWP
jgi:hypothetical protein